MEILNNDTYDQLVLMLYTCSPNGPIPAVLLAATDTIYDVPLLSPVNSSSLVLASCS